MPDAIQTTDTGAQTSQASAAAQTTQTTQTTQGTQATTQGTQTTGKEATTQAGLVTGTTGQQAQDKTVTAPADWPDDWRDKAASGDDKFRKRLDRFASPADLVRSYRALEQKVSSGEVKQPLPENATDEQKTAWRKDNGIPDKPEAYVEKVALPNGMVVGEADKPLIGEFAKMAHGKNWTPGQFNDALSFYYETQDKEQQAVLARDSEHRKTAEDALRGEWGNDYRRFTAGIDNFLGSAPDGLGKLLAGGRLADGTMIANDPRFIKWMNGLNMELNPASTLVPAGSDAGKALSSRKAEIEKRMREDRSGYFKDQPMQAEYLKILEAEERMNKRSAA